VMGRTIFLGDVHGCLAEFQELLDRLAVSSSDRLISVGDLICKGPDSAGVLDLALSLPNLQCVVGNHEARYLEYWRGGDRPTDKTHDEDTVRQMEPRYREYMAYIASWPLYLSLKEALVIHAGLRPGLPLEQQDLSDLTELREVGPKFRPWYEWYRNGKPAVFGHWVRREPLLLEHAIGLDTGCVYGGELTACILPAREIVSVKARRIYQPRR